MLDTVDGILAYLSQRSIITADDFCHFKEVIN